MLKKYPYIAKGNKVEKLYDRAMIIRPNKDKLYITDYGFAALKKCNGMITLENILYDGLVENSGQKDFLGQLKKELEFFKYLKNQGIILVQDEPIEQKCRVSDKSDCMYPQDVMVELTDYCNLNCLHCYRLSHDQKKNYLPADKLTELFSFFRDIHVDTIHLTGGEPMSHPEFERIFVEASKNVKNIVVLSNGTMLSDSIIEVMRSHKEHLYVQIDLDGCHAETHDKLRGKKDSFSKAIRAIRRLKENEIYVRISMDVYHNNLSEVEGTVELAAKLGADEIVCSPIMEIGRGANLKALTSQETTQFLNLLQELYQKYPKFVKKASVCQEELEKRNNCGAGSKTIVIGPTGIIRPCVIMPENLIVMGNIFEEKYEDIFKKKIFKDFNNLKSPNLHRCEGCEFNQFCTTCFARTFLYEEKMKAIHPNFKCIWRTTYGGAYYKSICL